MILKIHKHYSVFLVFIIFMISCNGKVKNSDGVNFISDPDLNNKLKIKYARGFSITKYDGYKILDVFDPWQGAKQISFRYLLSEKGFHLPDSLIGSATVIYTPVERLVCTSTTHIALLEALGKTESVVGISGAGLITNMNIHNRINTGEIRDIGYDRELNYEILISLWPEMVIIYGVESEVTGFINKLNDLNIPVVMNGEYLEENPLGKLEWIKFIAAFFNLEKEATEIFDSVENKYISLKSRVDSVTNKPVVMTGLPWKDVWYVSAGNTTVARFIEDAGGEYLWKDLKSSKAIPMGLESVYEKAAKVEIWINPGTAGSLSDVLNEDDRFRHFLPVRNGKVFNNIARLNPSGGNDYWESGLTHPHWILKDLIHIFHPEVEPDHELFYYHKLNY